MDKVQKFEDCFEVVAEAANAKAWANICKIVGWVIVGVFALIGIIAGALGEEGGFLIFLVAVIAGFISAATFWILGAVLDALASSAQSNAETARMTYFRMQADSKELLAKRYVVQREQKEKRQEDEERAFRARVAASVMPSKESEPKAPAEPWICQYCGKENSPWDNICNQCGEKKVE